VAFNHFCVYPPRTGGAVRAFEILKSLALNGCSVKLYTYDGPESELRVSGIEMHTVPKPLLSLIRLGGLLGHTEGKIAVDALLNVHPRLSARAKRDIILSDVVQTEHLWASLFPLILAKRHAKPSVFDDHNVEYVLAKRSYGVLDSRARYFQPLWAQIVKHLERICCMLADVILVTSENDKRLLSDTFEVPSSKIFVAENGVNTDEIYPSEASRSRIRAIYGFGESDPVLLFLGKYDYPPNLVSAEFIVEKVAPVLFERYPNAKILMVGRYPPEHLSSDPRVIWTGEVDSIMPYVNACDLALAPIPLGSGTRLKILSYLACDRPVVATPEAVEGLHLRDGKYVLIRGFEDFTDAVIGLLEDTTTRAELGAGSSGFIRSNYDWKVTTTRVADVYRRLI
jgi:glycosyltransferase involved in cell wall biosynthesis